MNKKTDYTSAAQQRLIKTMLALRGLEDTGTTPSELAKRVGTTPSNVTRDLHNLKLAGIAEEIPDAKGRWRLGPALVQVALAYFNARDRARSRMNELENRYTRIQ